MGGLIPWFYIQEILGTGINIFKRYSYLVTKIKFPLAGIPTILQHFDVCHSAGACGGIARRLFPVRSTARSLFASVASGACAHVRVLQYVLAGDKFALGYQQGFHEPDEDALHAAVLAVGHYSSMCTTCSCLWWSSFLCSIPSRSLSRCTVARCTTRCGFGTSRRPLLALSWCSSSRCWSRW